jgi:hypothetical protein
MSEAPDNVVQLNGDSPAPEQPATQETAAPQNDQPKTLQELIQRIDIEGVTPHDVIRDLVTGIQQLAMRGTIALGLLERIFQRDLAEAQAEEEDLKS